MKTFTQCITIKYMGQNLIIYEAKFSKYYLLT